MSLEFVLDHRADVDPDGDVISDGSQSGTPWHKTVPARLERVPA